MICYKFFYQRIQTWQITRREEGHYEAGRDGRGYGAKKADFCLLRICGSWFLSGFYVFNFGGYYVGRKYY